MDDLDRSQIYGTLGILSCLDGATPETAIQYASMAGGHDENAVALRARMYLRMGDRTKALTDLETLMAKKEAHALVGGGTDPSKNSNSCGWGMADVDVLGPDPR